MRATVPGHPSGSRRRPRPGSGAPGITSIVGRGRSTSPRDHRTGQAGPRELPFPALIRPARGGYRGQAAGYRLAPPAPAPATGARSSCAPPTHSVPFRSRIRRRIPSPRPRCPLPRPNRGPGSRNRRFPAPRRNRSRPSRARLRSRGRPYRARHRSRGRPSRARHRSRGRYHPNPGPYRGRPRIAHPSRTPGIRSRRPLSRPGESDRTGPHW